MLPGTVYLEWDMAAQFEVQKGGLLPIPDICFLADTVANWPIRAASISNGGNGQKYSADSLLDCPRCFLFDAD